MGYKIKVLASRNIQFPCSIRNVHITSSCLHKMKILFILLAFIAVAVATSYDFKDRVDAYDRSISSQIIEFIEKIKKQMPCGFPRLGLGPLSPARLSHRQIELNSDGLALTGEIDNFTLYGLDDFEIVQFKVNVILNKANFQFKWRKVHLDTKYKIDMNTGNKIKLGRHGGAKFAIENFVVVGSAKYSVLSKLRLKEFKISATIGNVKSEIDNLSNIKIVNKKLNEIIEEWIMMAVNENTKEMEQMANKFVVPLVNEKIGDATLSDLIGLILGGGGGNGGGGGKECIPEQFVVIR